MFEAHSPQGRKLIIQMIRNIIISVIIAVVIFLSGRYSAPVKIETVTKTVEVQTKHEVLNENKKEHTTTVTTKKTDGSVVTTKTQDISTGTQVTESERSMETTASITTRVTRESELNISLLSGVSKNSLTSPFYGVSLTKSIIEPLTVGAWYLGNGTMGVSLGIDF